MPNLPGSDAARDMAMFNNVLHNPDLQVRNSRWRVRRGLWCFRLPTSRESPLLRSPLLRLGMRVALRNAEERVDEGFDGVCVPWCLSAYPRTLRRTSGRSIRARWSPGPRSRSGAHPPSHPATQTSTPPDSPPPLTRYSTPAKRTYRTMKSNKNAHVRTLNRTLEQVRRGHLRAVHPRRAHGAASEREVARAPVDTAE